MQKASEKSKQHGFAGEMEHASLLSAHDDGAHLHDANHQRLPGRRYRLYEEEVEQPPNVVAWYTANKFEFIPRRRM